MNMGLYIGNMQNTILPAKVRNVLDEDVPMYGVKYDYLTSEDRGYYTRTYDAADLVFEPSVKSSNTHDPSASSSAIAQGRDDFKSLAPFNVRECYRVYDNGEATYYYKDNYTDAGWYDVLLQNQASSTDDDVKSIPTGGLAMIEFPEFWYKRVHIGDGGFEIIVSPQYKQGFTPDPWHYKDGVHYNKRYISKYPAPSAGRDINGNYVTPRSLTYFRNDAYPKGLKIIYPEVYYSLLMLMMVKYGTTDIPSIFGNGNHGASTSANYPGFTWGMDDGYTLGKDKDASSIVMMGIENFYGHLRKILDACASTTESILLADIDSISQYTDLLSNSESELYYLNYQLIPDGSNLASSMYCLYDSIYDWLFPIVGSGNIYIYGDRDRIFKNNIYCYLGYHTGSKPRDILSFGGYFRESDPNPLMITGISTNDMNQTKNYNNNNILSTFYVC